jgi:hypothetical protein
MTNGKMVKYKMRIYAALAGLFVGCASYCALTSTRDVASGWWQVAIAVAGLPILLYELSRIRQAIEQKPVISIGLATDRDLPSSKIREAKSLPTTVNVSQGYAHFYLVVRNQGPVRAEFVKIHLEHTGSSEAPNSSPLYLYAPPLLRVSEFSESKPSFHQENNAECVFVGGSDWVVHPNDSEIFGFHMTSSLVKQTEPVKIMEFPKPCDCYFHCTVWAETRQPC